VASDAAEAARGFVVQQHAARRLHWDFRLEIEGVLVSWAVPRGPAVDPKEKRLAVQTEDHPLEYGSFEGIIPAGNYGAGAVIVWDCGTYQCVDGVAPAEGLAKGKLDLRLNGHKLRGRWALVRTKRGEGKEWLLFKKADEFPTSPEPVIAQPASVFSGLTVEELGDGHTKTAELVEMAQVAGAKRGTVKAPFDPMKAQTADKAFSRDGWLFELKYDGVRALIARAGNGEIKIFFRSRRDGTPTFPDVAEAAKHLPCDSFVIDGEIIAVDGRGTGSFETLQQRLGQTNPSAVARAVLAVPVVFYGFDLPSVAGYDLRSLPLRVRKALLRHLLPPTGVLRFSDHIEGRGAELFEEVRERHLEGIVAKRADSTYQTGHRSRDWLKIKAPRTADLAIVGWMSGKGSRADLGSLMLAWVAEDGNLVYAGNAGSGLDAATVDRLLPILRQGQRDTPAFEAAPDLVPRGANFTKPQLVAEVRYTEVTSAGLLRHPVFLRQRPDKELADCDTLQGARGWGLGDRGGQGNSDSEVASEAKRIDPNPQPLTPNPLTQVRFTNLDKVFWPEDGYTKGDLLRYYEEVWPWIEPYLRNRPVVLTRYPDGIHGKSFFQKNAPEFVPDWVPTCRIEDTEYFVCDDLQALLYVINLGCIPLHAWSARRNSIEHPDWTILDLDPKGAPFSDVLRVAKHVHQILAPLDAPHFIKTSGQDGLHILIPLNASLTHEDAKTFAEVLARVVASELPDIATVARPLGDRGGKVYVDFLQNGFGKTIAGPLSARPRAGAPVSTPLDWTEVNGRLDPSRFSIRSVPKRLAKRGDPMREVLGSSIDVREVLAALTERMNATAAT
jgi:bifunctional non-homologous end joining protein LigD